MVLILAGYKLGNGTVGSLTAMQQEFITSVEVWKQKRAIELAGFEVDQPAEEMTVEEYADRLAAVRRTHPGALEYLTS